jgi:hypothetical protein
MFKGMEYGSYMVWPCRMVKKHKIYHLFQTGQQLCYNESGAIIDCNYTGQDGEFHSGMRYKKDRFTENGHIVYDKATGLTWFRSANAYEGTLDWRSAFDFVSEMNNKWEFGHNDWRIPNVIELESLTDMGQHSPALPADHLFNDVRDFYWSSITSMYDKNYAMGNVYDRWSCRSWVQAVIRILYLARKGKRMDSTSKSIATFNFFEKIYHRLIIYGSELSDALSSFIVRLDTRRARNR